MGRESSLKLYNFNLRVSRQSIKIRKRFFALFRIATISS